MTNQKYRVKKKKNLLYLVADRPSALYFLHQPENTSWASRQRLKATLRRGSALLQPRVAGTSHGRHPASREAVTPRVAPEQGKLQLSEPRSTGVVSLAVTARRAGVAQQVWTRRATKSQRPSAARCEASESRGRLGGFKAATSSSRYQFERNATVPKGQHHAADIEWPLRGSSKGPQTGSQRESASLEPPSRSPRTGSVRGTRGMGGRWWFHRPRAPCSGVHGTGRERVPGEGG